MVNILISGYYGFDNIGDESILRTLVSSLREHIPDCSLTVLSHNPACGDGKSILITELQQEGGKRMAANAFLNGKRIAAGTILDA